MTTDTTNGLTVGAVTTRTSANPFAYLFEPVRSISEKELRRLREQEKAALRRQEVINEKTAEIVKLQEEIGELKDLLKQSIARETVVYPGAAEQLQRGVGRRREFRLGARPDLKIKIETPRYTWGRAEGERRTVTVTREAPKPPPVDPQEKALSVMRNYLGRQLADAFAEDLKKNGLKFTA